MKRLNAPGSAAQSVTRINEMSSHFEDTLRELLNSTPDLSCDFRKLPKANSTFRLSDLRIVDLASKRVFYLDPKLYATGSRHSSFRTFYFEPKIATNKVARMRCISLSGSNMKRKKKARRGNSLAGRGRSFAVQSETQSRVQGATATCIAPKRSSE